MRSAGIGRIGSQGQRERVPTVGDQVHRRVVRPAHDLPGVAVVGDVAAPGQRLEGPTSTPDPWAISPSAQVARGAVDPARGRGGGVGAHEQAPRAQLVHDPEPAPRAPQAPRARGSGIPSKSRKGWKATVFQAVVAARGADLARRALVGDHVGLEDLDPLEARARDGGELVGERAAGRDGGDGEPHAAAPSARRRRASSMGRP